VNRNGLFEIVVGFVRPVRIRELFVKFDKGTVTV